MQSRGSTHHVIRITCSSSWNLGKVRSTYCKRVLLYPSYNYAILSGQISLTPEVAHAPQKYLGSDSHVLMAQIHTLVKLLSFFWNVQSLKHHLLTTSVKVHPLNLTQYCPTKTKTQTLSEHPPLTRHANLIPQHNKWQDPPSTKR
jgi:hypothetical protein